MFKNYNQYLKESVQDSSGSMGSETDTSIDASGPVIDEWLSVDIQVDDTSDGENAREIPTAYISAYLPDKIHIYQDLNIDHNWNKNWTPEMKSKMDIIMSHTEEKIINLFKEVVIESKKMIVDAGDQINKLDPHGKTGNKYNI